jgi:hypothetical protein
MTMSDARNERFEIDLDEIEKQLRRSVEAPQPARSDPLAELARIVGQEDPFRGIFAKPPGQGADTAPPVASPGPRPSRDGTAAKPAPAPADAALLQGYRREEEAVLHGDSRDDLFDPVASAYGSPQNALDDEDFRPLQPRRSRKTLLVVGGLVVAAVVGTAGTLAWRNGPRLALGSGAPPVIQADNSPLKVAPENPGGMEIPNQNKQIYERAAPESQTRVVDRREQPIDVREAAKALPPAPQPNPVATTPDSGRPADAAPARPARPNAVSTALGEPRRVRTVSVRSDGSSFDGPPAPALGDPSPALLPAANSLPPPVQVATIPITLGAAQGTGASPAPATGAPPAAAGTPPAGPSVSVLPPQRPRDGVTATPTAPRVAAVPAETAPEPAAAGGGTRAFTVQLGIRPTEQEARTASTQLAAKYAGDLGGRVPAVARAEVNGKTVYRMRVGPLSRDDANALCTRLKGAGGQCFVAQN